MLNFDIIYQEFYSNKIEIVKVDSISSFAKLLKMENKTYLMINKNLNDDNLKLDILVEMLSIFYFNFPTTFPHYFHIFLNLSTFLLTF